MIPQWQSGPTMATGSYHVAHFYDDLMGVEMVVETPKRRDTGEFRKGRMRYAIRGVRKVFLTEDDMIDAWEKMQKPGGIRIEDRCVDCGGEL